MICFSALPVNGTGVIAPSCPQAEEKQLGSRKNGNRRTGAERSGAERSEEERRESKGSIDSKRNRIERDLSKHQSPAMASKFRTSINYVRNNPVVRSASVLIKVLSRRGNLETRKRADLSKSNPRMNSKPPSMTLFTFIVSNVVEPLFHVSVCQLIMYFSVFDL